MDQSEKKFSRGSIIAMEGEIEPLAYTIISGSVKVFKMNQGRRVTVAHLGPGQIFGELSLVLETPRNASIIADPITGGSYHFIDVEAALGQVVTDTFSNDSGAATDWLDGFLARKLNQMSSFGAFLDPVADKFLVCASLLVLVHLQRAGQVHSAFLCD